MKSAEKDVILFGGYFLLNKLKPMHITNYFLNRSPVFI